MSTLWPLTLRLNEVGRAGLALDVVADEATRARIAASLDLVALNAFSAHLTIKPWFDGAEITARWKADIVQTCGVTLEDFDTALAEPFTVRLVPKGSIHAPAEDSEAIVDPEADDPADVLDDGVIDLGAYLVEHLTLEVDPFPRKPGAVFEPPPADSPPSPFAVLQKLNPRAPSKGD
ncbi:MAG: DUF177 domain-containing protein [Caulobacteraceae bacterium]